MGTYGKDYYENIEWLKKYAECEKVGNQLFLGVKGVGKSYLFKSYFTDEKIKELAERYKNIFVVTALNNRNKDSDIYSFIFDQVLRGIISVVDSETMVSLKNELEIIKTFFETDDTKLRQFLSVIKNNYHYEMVLIMDHFHTMARDNEIGLEQYELLRSLCQEGLITYWLITDTDLKETGVSEDFTASFFAQNFTKRDTICPCCEDEHVYGEGMLSILETFLKTKKYELGDEEKTLIAELSGGVPVLYGMLLDGLNGLNGLNGINGSGTDISRDELISAAITNKSWGCISLFSDWTEGLSSKQKEIIYRIAESPEGKSENEIKSEFNHIESYELSELSDEVGRGLLHEKMEGGSSRWIVINEIFRQYVATQGEVFYRGEAEIVPYTETAGSGNILQDNPAFIPSGNPAFAAGVGNGNAANSVTNIYIQGDYIQNQTTNVLNIDRAVEGIEDLFKLVKRDTALPDNRLMESRVACLPSRQEAWLEMNEEEREDALDEFAEGLFTAPTFGGMELSDEQKSVFNLTDNLLTGLMDNCRKQLICGIQIHDMLQYCMDTFGLDIGSDESPRGILFAKSFEQALKDFVRPAFLARNELKEYNVKGTKFKDLNEDRTTIGNYYFIIRDNLSLFSNVSVNDLADPGRNINWWQAFANRLDNIGGLRNGICHSGPPIFDINKLTSFKDGIFNHNTLDNIMFFRDIENSFRGVVSGPAYPMGSMVHFRVDSQNKGRMLGVVDGVHPALLKKSCAQTLDFEAVKGIEIVAVVENFQNGKLVLKL